jgi:hypothetical protein
MTPTTDRETAAAKRLADAILDFMLAVEEGKQTRDADRAARIAATRSPRNPREAGWAEGSESQDQRLLNAKEAARYLGIGERKLWEMTAPRGPIVAVRLGALVRYAQADLDSAADRCRVRGPAPTP